MHDSDYVMDFYTEITYVSNTINKLHFMSDLHSSYIHNFYHYKQYSIDGIFCQYIKTLSLKIDHSSLIKEWKKILMLMLTKKLNE